MTPFSSAVNLQQWPLGVRWVALTLLSAVAAVFFEYLHLPAALLLGPMAIGILFAVSGAELRLSSPLFSTAQGFLGAMIASKLPLNIWSEVGQQWYVFLFGTLSTLFASSLLGWLLSRSSLLPGTTAIWGSAPGAASVMTLMSESYGADMRLVAFMQYLRVVFCVLGATLVGSTLGASGVAMHQIDWFGMSPWQGFGATLVLVFVCVAIGRRMRMPSGALLLPMLVGMLVKSTGLMPLVLPQWVLAISYAILGWGIGFRFTPKVLAHAARLLPFVIGAILVLLLANAGFAVVLMYWTHIDYLSAFLATNPGGADSVAIIAASTQADLPFVMAMQLTRFLLVMITGPLLARWLSGKSMAAIS